MREVHIANTTVTLFQAIAVIIAYLLFDAELAGISLTAAITAGIIALAMTQGTWVKPSDAHRHGVSGLIALSAAAAALGLWLWNQGQDFVALCALAVACVLTHLLAKKARQWSERPYATLVVTALPNVGVILGAIIGFFVLIRKVVEEL